MLMIIISRSNLKLGHVGSKTRSPGQILEKPCVHTRGHRFDHKFMKLYQNVNCHMSRSDLKLGHVGSKTRSNLRKTLLHWRRHNFDSKVMKLCQNLNHHNI